MTTQSLPIDRIRRDGGTQTRAEISADKVAEYAEDMRAGAEFPAVVVFHDGSTYWLADGFHRVAAAEAAGLAEVACELKQGDRRAAILYSVGANATHGLRRTNADKRRAVTVLLEDEEWRTNSARWIAEKCGVDEKLVRRIRDESGAAKPHHVVGKDGVQQPAAKPRAAPPSPPSDAPNPYVAVRSAIACARTSADLVVAGDELARYEERGSLSPKEAAELRAAYTVASTRVLLDDKPTPPGGRARKVVLDDEEGAAARVRATPIDPPEGANDDDEDDESAPGQVFEAADEPPMVIRPDRDERRWGDGELSSAVVALIGVTRDFRARLDTAFDAVDSKFKDDFAKRVEDTLLTTIEALMSRLPVDDKRADDNRSRFQIVTGGK